MRRLRRILIPISDTDRALEPIRQALSVADRASAKIDVLHVVPPGPLGGQLQPALTPAPSFCGPAPGGPVLSSVNDLCALRSRVTVPSGVNLSFEVRQGRPSQVIVEASPGYDLIVLGTQRSTGWLQRLFGVTRRVQDQAACPVMTVRT